MNSQDSRDIEPIPDNGEDHERVGFTREPRWQFIAWLGVCTALIVWIAVGSVSTTSYTYNQFLGMTRRDVSDTALQDIWSQQVEELPDVRFQWALDGVFVLSILVVLVCVVAGSWLLLVRASDPRTPQHRRARRLRSASSS